MSVKRIVSFDVGIKNLAYCILDIDYEKDDFFIIDWDIINLADDRIKCCHIGRKKCTTIANSFLKLDENKYYCRSHKAKADIELKNLELDITKYNKKCMKCKSEETFVYNDMILCERHLKMQLRKDKLLCQYKKCDCIIEKYIMIDNKRYGWCNKHYLIGKDELINKRRRKFSQSCNRISLDKLCENMIRKLDSIDFMLSIDEVLIENQPTLKNPTMKTISTFLFSYFVSKKTYKKAKDDIIIKFVAPSNKIKVGGKKATERVSKTQKDSVYEITKGLGVKICKVLVSHNKLYEEMLDKHKKKDDLADAFLQGIIMNYKLPEKYLKKINDIDMNTINNKKINKIEKTLSIDDELIDDEILKGKKINKILNSDIKNSKSYDLEYYKKKYIEPYDDNIDNDKIDIEFN
jgi:hypothetical protein